VVDVGDHRHGPNVLRLRLDLLELANGKVNLFAATQRRLSAAPPRLRYTCAREDQRPPTATDGCGGGGCSAARLAWEERPSRLGFRPWSARGAAEASGGRGELGGGGMRGRAPSWTLW
jgi:hypothetical protein